MDLVGVAFEVGAALADRLQEAVERGGQLLLDLDVADGPLAVAVLQVVDLGRVGVEGVVVHEDGVALDVAGVGGVEAGGVGVHAPHHLGDGLGVVLEEDAVVEALAHLAPVVGAHEPGDAAGEAPGLGEDLGVLPVELAGDLAGHLDVGHLVLAHGHEVGLGQQDVRDLADGVGVEADGEPRGLLLDALRLRLERRVALEARQRRDHAEQHRQFGVLRHVALDDEGAVLGVEPDGEPVHGHLDHRAADAVDVVGVVAQRLVVGDEEEALVLPLEPQPALQGPHVVAKVERPRGADAGQDALAFHCSPLASVLNNKRPIHQGTGLARDCHPRSPGGPGTLCRARPRRLST